MVALIWGFRWTFVQTGRGFWCGYLSFVEFDE